METTRRIQGRRICREDIAWLQGWMAAHPEWSGLRQLFDDGRLEFRGALEASRHPEAFRALVREATAQPWIVYAKRPFAGPKPVLAYLARYTHRVGITNQRIRAVDRTAQTVTFDYKDYADGSQQKQMSVACDEFVRRLRLHILPARFVKIRHYGLLSNRNRHAPSPRPAQCCQRCPRWNCRTGTNRRSAVTR